MKSPIAILVGFMALILLTVVLCIGMYVKHYNMGVNFEKRLEAVWQENTVMLNNYTVKVQEMIQVPEMYKDSLKDVIQATFSGRYGKDGSKAVFQMIQEKNINFDPSMYKQVQQVMESGRNEFAQTQKILIDLKANYQAKLDYFWSGFWLNLAGYPKVDLNKYKVLAMDEVTQKMESGKDSIIKLK